MKLKPGEYFICDLIGLQVSDEEGKFLGTLTEVIQTGANDVYVVKMENEKEVLIPNIKECIIKVSLEENSMTVHLLEGLALRFHVLTLFPEMIEQGFHTSITGRAMEKGLLSLNAVNIRDFAGNKHMKVDDYPYGGGAGMVMQAEPVYAAHQSLEDQAGRKLRTSISYPTGTYL